MPHVLEHKFRINLNDCMVEEVRNVLCPCKWCNSVGLLDLRFVRVLFLILMPDDRL